jgi:hypothetical protein
LKSVNRHCCVANTHALDHKTLNAHAQIRKTDLNPGLDKPRQEKNYEMCEIDREPRGMSLAEKVTNFYAYCIGLSTQ